MKKYFDDEGELREYLNQSKKDGITRFASVEMRAWYNPMRWIKGKFYYIAL